MWWVNIHVWCYLQVQKVLVNFIMMRKLLSSGPSSTFWCLVVILVCTLNYCLRVNYLGCIASFQNHDVLDIFKGSNLQQSQIYLKKIQHFHLWSWMYLHLPADKSNVAASLPLARVTNANIYSFRLKELKYSTISYQQFPTDVPKFMQHVKLWDKI